MDITANTIRYVLFVCNAFFVMTGVALLVVGFFNVYNNDDENQLLTEQDVNIVGFFFIFIGLCIFIVTSFGCWGALYEKYSLIFAFGISLSVLLVLQLLFYGLAVYLCSKNSSHAFIEKAMDRVFHEYRLGHNSTDFKSVLVDQIQTRYSCCGIEGPNYWNKKKNSIPLSCCSNSVHLKKKCTFENAYQNGCLNSIEMFIKSRFREWWIIVSLFAQVFVIASTFYLAREIRTSRNE